MAKKPDKIPKPQPQEQKINFKDLLSQRNLGAGKPIIEAIERKRESKLICLVYNDAPPVPTMLTPAVLVPLEQILKGIGKVPRLDLFLRCTGGITEVPWRFVSLLREFTTEKLGVIVSRAALSGATHIAIAADELVMTPFSVISSVDPTRRHPLLPKDAEGRPIPTSVEDLKHCIKFIREQLGESYPNQNLALIISELFKYINPLALGALEQSYELSRLITSKCLKTRKVPLPDEQIVQIVEQLAGKYFSHTFLISRSEVESDLGLPITKPDDELSQLILELDNHYLQQFQEITRFIQPNGEAFFRVGGVMQTAENGWSIAMLYQKDGRIIFDQWIPFN
jgi:hypothetical protein